MIMAWAFFYTAADSFCQAGKQKYPLAVSYDEPFILTIAVDPQSGTGSVDTVDVLLYRNPAAEPERIPMKQGDDNLWFTKVSVTDTSVKMVYWQYEVRTGPGKGKKIVPKQSGTMFGDAVLHDSLGKPVKNGYMQRALTFTGGGSRNETNLLQAVRDLMIEIREYPENLEARMMLYTVLLKQGSTEAQVSKQIEKDIKNLYEFADSTRVAYFSMNAYALVGQMDKVKDIEKKLLEDDPHGIVAAQKDFADVMQTEDAAERMEKLEEFLQAHGNGPLKEAALSGVATAAIELDDTVKMVEIGDRLLRTAEKPSSARIFSGIAGTLSERRVSLAKAEQYAVKALELLEKAKTAGVPPGMDSADWTGRIETTEGRYRDILGWIYFLQGDSEKALGYLSKAVTATRQPAVFYHYATVLSHMQKREDALKWFARASVFGGEVADTAYVDFIRLWNYLGKPDAQIEPYIKKEADYLKSSYTKKVLANREISPAPDFELETVDGEWIVSLRDQRGVVVLVCFWATWSRSSAIMLRQLESLSREWSDSVLFITIVTDRELDAVDGYMGRHKISLPVLLNEGTDAFYNVRGVPTLFVIDKKGNIQFVHKGYRPDLRDRLAIEINDLLEKP